MRPFQNVSDHCGVRRKPCRCISNQTLMCSSFLLFAHQVSHEFQFVVGILHYIQARLSASATVQAAQLSRDLRHYDGSGIGSFLDLHCGHNNPFSNTERESLKILIDVATNVPDDAHGII